MAAAGGGSHYTVGFLVWFAGLGVVFFACMVWFFSLSKSHPRIENSRDLSNFR